MQVTETLSDGLKREYRVVVPAQDLDSKVNARLDERMKVDIKQFGDNRKKAQDFIRASGSCNHTERMGLPPSTPAPNPNRTLWRLSSSAGG